MRHLSDTSEAALLDRAPFAFSHSLVGHPSLSLESLARTIAELPSTSCNYSKGLADVAVNFDRSFDENKNGLSLIESFERLKEVSSYITIMDRLSTRRSVIFIAN